jgi:8-oxo-dGTP pyrophosphatase MutT (NUDIX family)
MKEITRKAQVVLAAFDSSRQKFFFLLLRTNQRRGLFWQNITGKVEHGESFEDGALREAMEETGLKAEMLVDLRDLQMAFEFTDQYQRQVKEKVFLLITQAPWEITLDPSEHAEFKWLSEDEVHATVVKFPSNGEALMKALQELKRWGK